jgi:spermidine synthase
LSKKALLLLCAALAGASGMGLEVLLVDLAGLTIGYGLSALVGIALFLSGWSIGAWMASGLACSSSRALLAAGALLALSGWAAPHFLVGVAGLDPGPGPAWAATALALFLVALPQGSFLPLLARGWSLRPQRGDLGLFFAANLVGAACGAFLIGERIPALWGRGATGAAAGALALLAALLGAALLRGNVSGSAETRSAPAGVQALSLPRAGAILAFATAWVASLEWLGVRLGVLWLGGMQEALGSILVASLAALGLGALVLPRLLPRGSWGPVVLGGLCCLSPLAYACLPELLGRAQGWPPTLRALLIVGPVLLPFGAWVPLLHRALAGESARRLGRLLAFEALGALVGLPLVHLLVFPLGGTIAVLGFFQVSAALGVVLLAPARRLRVASLCAALLVPLGFASRTAPARESPPLSDPAFEVLEFTEDQHFAVSVVQDGLLGERTLLTDGFRAAASGRDYAYMRALGHLPLLLHQDPAVVGVLAFGTGTTAGAVSLHAGVRSIEVLEMSRAVIDQAGHFREVNRGVLEDPRVQVVIGDGRHVLARRPATYDVLTMEPLLPDSPFGVYLYTEEFYSRARSALKPGGLLCQWVPPHALEPASFEAVVGAFTSAFEWSSAWVFGTQVLLLGGRAAPQPSPRRFPTDGGDLQAELRGLGLDSLPGVLARFVLTGAAWPAPERPLRDLDPWILYRPRRRGSVLLADLPLNLATLRERREELPLEWWVGLEEGARGPLAAVALLREVREVRAASDALTRIRAEAGAEGGWLDADRASRLTALVLGRTSRREQEGLLLEAAQLAPDEAGLLRFEAQLEFEDGLRQGLGALLRSSSEAAAGDAAQALMRSVALRPERADAHAYLAIALERLGSERARVELAEALRLCPRLQQTSAGKWLTRLGAVR